jgi:hypothetical protein
MNAEARAKTNLIRGQHTREGGRRCEGGRCLKTNDHNNNKKISQY